MLYVYFLLADLMLKLCSILCFHQCKTRHDIFPSYNRFAASLVLPNRLALGEGVNLTDEHVAFSYSPIIYNSVILAHALQAQMSTTLS